MHVLEIDLYNDVYRFSMICTVFTTLIRIACTVAAVSAWNVFGFVLYRVGQKSGTTDS